jgi:hypothetical protein
MSAWWSKLVDKVLGTRESSTGTAATEATDGVRVETDAVVKQGRVRRVTVGLDYGTSSTKCCFRENADEKPFHFVAHDRGEHHGSSLLFPTSVAIDQGRLFTGFAAELRAGSSPLRSFKMCLLCQAQAAIGRAASVACKRCLGTHPGHFELGGQHWSAEDLSTIYLSVVLGQALARLPVALGVEAGQLRVQVNSAAPLDQMSEFGQVGRFFDRAVFYAFRLAHQSRQGWDVDQVRRALDEVRREPLPAVEQSPTRVFPETHAAITGYLMLPESERGLYGLIDVGAGTTDVAFFWLQKDEAVTKAWYYAAGSRPVGMDDIDSALESVHRESRGNLRRLREQMSHQQLQGCAALLAPVVKSIWRHYAGVLGDAMKVDQRVRAWHADDVAKFRLFMVGGGARCRPLASQFEKSPGIVKRWERYPQCLSVPGRARVCLPDGSVSTINELRETAVASLLLLAFGLSHPRPDIPAYDRDEDGVARAEPSHRGFGPDELYGHT